MAFKLVISDSKSGLSVQKEVDDKSTKNFIGFKIGDTVKGELIDLHGYEFLLTGGSDYCGFPMRRDVTGVGRKKILAYQGVGVKKDRKGILQRKTVCGNTVHAKTAQINMKVVKHGTTNIFAGVAKKLADKKAGKKPAEASAEEKPAAPTADKPAAKVEKKEKPTAKPAADKKERKPTEQPKPAAKKASPAK